MFLNIEVKNPLRRKNNDSRELTLFVDNEEYDEIAMRTSGNQRLRNSLNSRPIAHKTSLNYLDYQDVPLQDTRNKISKSFGDHQFNTETNSDNSNDLFHENQIHFQTSSIKQNADLVRLINFSNISK